MFEEQKRIMKIKLETQRKTLSDKIKTASRHIPTFQIILWRQELHEVDMQLKSFA